MLTKVVLVGYDGKKPERKPPKHGSVANIALIITETVLREQTRTNESRTEWHRVVIYENLVDVMQNYQREQTKADRGYWHIHELIQPLAIEKEILLCNTRPMVFENLFKSRDFVFNS